VRPYGLWIEINDKEVKIEIGVAVATADVPKPSKAFDFLASPEDSDLISVNLGHGLTSQTQEGGGAAFIVVIIDAALWRADENSGGQRR
jgi:hypothetical protein